MAEINLQQRSGRRKLQPPRIDLTPRVDLGFLLITFFMITTTLARPKTMELRMPSNEVTNKPTVFPEESTITVMPVSGHNVVYYFGTLNDKAQLKHAPLHGIRDILLKKKQEANNLPPSLSADAHKLHVVIKPNDNCKYEDVVYMLDEMNIVDVPFYVLGDISALEKEMLGQ